MKRCPECRRDYYDDSLLYCLDDGRALLEGPAKSEQPVSADRFLGNHSATAKLYVDRPPHERGTAMFQAADDRTPEAANSIAVLPFVNISADADNEYFCDGLAEELLSALAKIDDLNVPARTSAFSFKGKNTDISEIGRKLGVANVLEGSVRKSGSRLRIAVQLLNATDGYHIWSETYDREMRDIFEIQDEITLAVVDALKVKLLAPEKRAVLKRHTIDSEAYQLYLKGRFYYAKRAKEDILRSIELFREAMKLDPNFALAYVGIAESFAVMPSYPYRSPREAIPQAKAAAARALELDATLPEGHSVAGSIACFYDWDWAEGERRFKRAIELDPNLALTHSRYAWVCLSPVGRHGEAIAGMKRAMELEPLSLIQGAIFAAVLMYARHFDAAFEQAEETYALDPNHVGARHWIFHTMNAKGRYAESLSILERFLQTGFMSLAQTGYAYAKSGQRQKAEAVIARLKEAEKTEYVMNYWVAVTYAALGEHDAASAELEKAFQARDWFLPRLKTDPFMDSLRDDPRFQDLIRRMGLPQ